jgi:hypothetical protein
VQYYFNNKEGLVSAILSEGERRREIIRRKKFNALKKKGKHYNTCDLLAILWLPIIDDDEYLSCQFLVQCMLKQDTGAYNHFHKSWVNYFQKSWEKMKIKLEKENTDDSTAYKILMELKRNHKNIPQDVLFFRLSALSSMFVYKAAEFGGDPNIEEKKPFDAEPILSMGVAALAAPVP